MTVRVLAHSGRRRWRETPFAAGHYFDNDAGGWRGGLPAVVRVPNNVSRRQPRSTERQEPVKHPTAPPTRSNDRPGLQRAVGQLLGDHAGKLAVDLDVKL